MKKMNKCKIKSDNPNVFAKLDFENADNPHRRIATVLMCTGIFRAILKKLKSVDILYEETIERKALT